LRLLKIALIYGTNASGKTAILKALDFLRDMVLEPKRTKTETLDFLPFLFDHETPKQNSVLNKYSVFGGRRKIRLRSRILQTSDNQRNA
jgi:AAA15 family ATPase/GTPase